MARQKRNPLFAAVAALVLAALACGGGRTAQAPTPTSGSAATPDVVPTTEAEPTEPQAIAAGELQVVSVAGYTDTFDYFHVVGEIMNQTERSLQSIELTVAAQDASGATLLRDGDDNPLDSDTFSPYLYTLAPGESSPFDYYFSLAGDAPASYEVTVTGFETGQANRADLEADNMQLVSDDSGSLFISGEVVNLGDAPAQINGLAAAALDDSDSVIAANGFGPYAHLLAPAGDENGNDRTPFRIRLDAPEAEATQWAVYFDADVYEDNLPPVDLETNALNFYADTFGGVHLVGEVTNNGDEALVVGLVAGLYDADGVTLDADSWTSPMYLAPGETLPYDFQYFSNVNSNADQAGAVDSYSVQMDLHPFWTYPAISEFVTLETVDDDMQNEGDGYVSFTANVANTSDQPLSSLTVVVAIYDTDDQLVATASTYVFPEGDEISPGQTMTAEATLYLDPELDTSDYTFWTWVQGTVR